LKIATKNAGAHEGVLCLAEYPRKKIGGKVRQDSRAFKRDLILLRWLTHFPKMILIYTRNIMGRRKKIKAIDFRQPRFVCLICLIIFEDCETFFTCCYLKTLTESIREMQACKGK